MATLQERMANELAEFDYYEPEVEEESSSEEPVEEIKEDETVIDEEELAAAAAFRNQFLSAATSTAARSRARKGGVTSRRAGAGAGAGGAPKDIAIDDNSKKVEEPVVEAIPELPSVEITELTTKEPKKSSSAALMAAANRRAQRANRGAGGGASELQENGGGAPPASSSRVKERRAPGRTKSDEGGAISGLSFSVHGDREPRHGIRRSNSDEGPASLSQSCHSGSHSSRKLVDNKSSSTRSSLNIDPDSIIEEGAEDHNESSSNIGRRRGIRRGSAGPGGEDTRIDNSRRSNPANDDSGTVEGGHRRRDRRPNRPTGEDGGAVAMSSASSSARGTARRGRGTPGGRTGGGAADGEVSKPYSENETDASSIAGRTQRRGRRKENNDEQLDKSQDLNKSQEPLDRSPSDMEGDRRRSRSQSVDRKRSASKSRRVARRGRAPGEASGGGGGGGGGTRESARRPRGNTTSSSQENDHERTKVRSSSPSRHRDSSESRKSSHRSKSADRRPRRSRSVEGTKASSDQGEEPTATASSSGSSKPSSGSSRNTRRGTRPRTREEEQNRGEKPRSGRCTSRDNVEEGIDMSQRSNESGENLPAHTSSNVHATVLQSEGHSDNADQQQENPAIDSRSTKISNSRSVLKGWLAGRASKDKSAVQETEVKPRESTEDLVEEEPSTMEKPKSMFKNFLGRGKTKAQGTDTGIMENIDEKDADDDTLLAESVPSEVDPTEDSQQNEEKISAAAEKASRNRFKGLLSREAKAITESKDVVVEERDQDTSDAKKKSTKWTGLRGGLDFAARLTLVQKEKKKDSGQPGDEDDCSKEFDAFDPSETNTDYTDGDTKEVMEDSTSKKPRKSSKASKWNVASKLKKNLKQEATATDKKGERDDDDDDDKPHPDYGLLMNSFNSFQEDALDGLSDHRLPDEEGDVPASKPDEESSQQSRRPAVRPAMDRRMVMGSFQGTSTKFHFSNHTQDSAIAVRKSKEEAAKELQEVAEESGSSLELDDDEFFDDAADDKKSSSNAVDAFDVFTSISSNPPDRRMVFSNSLLREPSQRFDFNKGTSHSATTSFANSQQEQTICEEEEEEEEECDSEEEAEPVKAIVEETEEKEDDHDDGSVNDAVEQEESKHQDYGELDNRHTTIEATESVDKEDMGESKEEIPMEAESDDATPFLSDYECLQLDFKSGFQVYIHALISVGDSDKGNSILMLNRKGVNLSKRMPQEDAALPQREVSPQAAEYSRLVKALKDSQQRTHQAQKSVQFLQKQIHHKRQLLGEIEKKRSRSMKDLAEKNIILKR